MIEPIGEARLTQRWLLLPAVALFACLVLRGAWVTEDAYITLRTVDNFVHGYGLRWNVIERVQAYTHPLWMFLLSLGYFVTREAFFTSLAIAFGCSLLAVLALGKMARSTGHGLVAILMLCCSRAFVDFSTSGLENPLTHLLVAAFFASLARAARLLHLALIVGFIAVNRSDAVLSVMPALVFSIFASWRAEGTKATARDLLIGMSPYLAWTSFSLFYYGVPFPNTAYAKLNTGIAGGEMMRQGVVYLLSSLGTDPALWVSIALALALAVHSRERVQWLLALGILLQLAYVVRVGGDFMAGRFLTLPLFLSAIAIARSPFDFARPEAAAVAIACVLAVFVLPRATEPWPVESVDGTTGILDERSFYELSASLSAFRRWSKLPAHGLSDAGRSFRITKTEVAFHRNIGFLGFHAGPTTHIVDGLALSDPLLARLPSKRRLRWRIGHYSRQVPRGYVEGVLSAECMMRDKKLCTYWQQLKLITRGPLWSWERFVAIAELNTGRLEHLIDRSAYRLPGLQPIAHSELPELVADGTPPGGPPAEVMSDSGIEVHLPQASHATQLTIGLDGDDDYRLELRLGSRKVAALTIESAGTAGMLSRHAKLPDAAQQQGFDSIRILPLRTRDDASLGHLKLLP